MDGMSGAIITEGIDHYVAEARLLLERMSAHNVQEIPRPTEALSH